jgi:hypothetical protein
MRESRSPETFQTHILDGFSNFSDEFPDDESSMQLNLFDF